MKRMMFYLSLLPPRPRLSVLQTSLYPAPQLCQTCRKPHKYLVQCDGCGSVYGLQTGKKPGSRVHMPPEDHMKPREEGGVSLPLLTSGPVTCYSGPGLARKCRKCPPCVPGPGSSARSRLTSVGRNQPSPRDTRHLANKHQTLEILSQRYDETIQRKQEL